MKKRFLPLAVLFLTVCLLSTACADVLFTPDDLFYKTHSEQCTYVGRSFYLNGKDGYVDFRSAPDSIVLDRLENGTAIHVYWQYENWGSTTIGSGKSQTDGWICLDDLVLKYDHISFEEEYGDKIKPYSGEFSDFDQKIPCINFYAYPGAPEIRMTESLKDNTSFSQDFMNALTSTTQSAISSVFIDESGLTWGYIGYWRGYRNIWFCLDNPAGDSFPLRVATPDLVPSSAPPSTLTGYLPYLLIGAVAVVTATLLVFMGIRSKKAKKPSSEH